MRMIECLRMKLKKKCLWLLLGKHRTALGVQTTGDTGLLQRRMVHSLDRLELLDQGLVLGVACQNVLHSQDCILTEDYVVR